MATNLKKLLGQQAHWTINKDLVRKIGLTETLILQQIIDLNYIFKKEEVFQSIQDMAEELGITEYSVKAGVAKLKKIGLISVERKSIGYRNFYSFNENAIQELLDKESFEEFMQIRKLSDNSSTTLKVRLGPQTIEFNSELNYDMSELNSTNCESNPIVGELKTASQRVENTFTITNNTTEEYQTNNIKTNNTDTEYIQDMNEYMDEVFTEKEEEDKSFREDMNEYMDYEFNKDTIRNHDYQAAEYMKAKLKQYNLL